MLKAASNDKELDSLGLESLSENLNGFVDKYRSTAVEQVYSSISVLRPCVNRIVRFLNDHGTAYTERLKLME